MDISAFLEPLDPGFDDYKSKKAAFGNVVKKYTDKDNFPDIEGYHIALIGIGEDRGAVHNDGCGSAPDIIRQKFYDLKTSSFPYKIADLGNLILGESLHDTYSAVSTILVELIREGILPVILGGSQDLTFAQYIAYQKLEETVNIVSVDASFDLGTTDQPVNSFSFLGKIVLHEPNFLFNFSNIGYQTYFVGIEQIELIN